MKKLPVIQALLFSMPFSCTLPESDFEDLILPGFLFYQSLNPPVCAEMIYDGTGTTPPSVSIEAIAWAPCGDNRRPFGYGDFQSSYFRQNDAMRTMLETSPIHDVCTSSIPLVQFQTPFQAEINTDCLGDEDFAFCAQQQWEETYRQRISFHAVDVVAEVLPLIEEIRDNALPDQSLASMTPSLDRQRNLELEAFLQLRDTAEAENDTDCVNAVQDLVTETYSAAVFTFEEIRTSNTVTDWGALLVSENAPLQLYRVHCIPRPIPPGFEIVVGEPLEDDDPRICQNLRWD